MPTRREYLGSTVGLDGKIYAIGGFGYPPNDNSSAQYLGTVEVYDPPNGMWTTRSSMPTARARLAVVTLPDGTIYAIGGFANSGVLPTVERYDPVTDTWSTRAGMPTARMDLAAAEADGKMYAAGGWREDQVNGFDQCTTYSVVESYDPSTDSWSTASSLPSPASGLTLTSASDGRLYAIGGMRQFCTPTGYTTSYHTSVDAFDPTAYSWTSPSAIPTPRFGLGASLTSVGTIFAVGGWDSWGHMGAVEEYSPAINGWATHSSLPTPRFGLGVVITPDNTLYAIGGNNYFGDLSTVEKAHIVESNPCLILLP